MLPTLAALAIASFWLVFSVAAFPNTIYIIRDAETPSLGLQGLTPVGHSRAATCIPNVFGKKSQTDIGLIVSCSAAANGSACHSAVSTVTPLATALKLKVDTKCHAQLNNEACVRNIMRDFAANSTKSILIAWDHDFIDDLFDTFDLDNDGPDFPDDSADIIFVIRNNNFVSQLSQSCPSIDGSDTNTTSIAGLVPGSFVNPGTTEGDTTSADGDTTSTDGSDAIPSDLDTNSTTTDTITADASEASTVESDGATVNTNDLFFTTTFNAPDPTPVAVSADFLTPSAAVTTLAVQAKKRMASHRDTRRMVRRHEVENMMKRGPLRFFEHELEPAQAP